MDEDVKQIVQKRIMKNCVKLKNNKTVQLYTNAQNMRNTCSLFTDIYWHEP